MSIANRPDSILRLCEFTNRWRLSDACSKGRDTGWSDLWLRIRALTRRRQWGYSPRDQCNVSRNSPVDASMNTDRPEVPSDSPQIIRQAGLGYLPFFSSSMEMVMCGFFFS